MKPLQSARFAVNLMLSPVWLGALLISSFAYADDSMSISPSIMYFHYVEFDDINNTQPDKETGFLPGIELQIDSDGAWRTHLQAGISFYAAQINYDGQTQGGTPVQTKSGATLRRTYLAIGRKFSSERTPMTVSFRIASSNWARDVKPHNGAIGIYEYYQWNEVGISVNQVLYVAPHQHLSINIDSYRVTAPSMTADFTPFGGTQVKFALRSNQGYQIKLNWMKVVSDALRYGLGLYDEYYSFGASNYIGGAYEPHSETNRVSLQFTLQKHF